nr:MAG TPA: hypothetical protein [Caudoviricetes sp.]
MSTSKHTFKPTRYAVSPSSKLDVQTKGVYI